MSSRKNEKNSLREQTSIMINISIDSNSFSFAISISYQPSSSLSSHSYYSYRDLYHSFTYNHHREHSSHISISSRNNIVTSSSITFKIGDNRDKLINYFNWLAMIYFIMKKWLQEYLLILKSKEIIYEIFLDISIILWKKWDIIDEIIIMIKRYIIKWNHEWVKEYAWVIIDEFKDIIIA